METVIDWSKAPESAEYGRKVHTGFDWYKYVDGALVYLTGYGTWEKAVTPPRMCIRRPATWTGEGLPPVGIEIEAMLPALGTARFWQIAKVVHGPLPESPGEILVFSLENTKPNWVDEFRPIRTPEQIEADERAAAIKEMVSACYYSGSERSKIDCAALYDAGWRKVTP